MNRIELKSGIVRKFAPFFSLILLAAFLALLSPHFLTMDNLFAIGLQMAVVAIIAIGELMVIITGGIDLSVGSILAFCGVLSTLLISKGSGIFLGITAGIVGGAVLGYINGVLITKGKLPPFIATLGMMGIAKGAALIITGGIPIFGLPESFNFIGGGRIFNTIPFPVLLTICLAVLGHFILKYTLLGRYTYSIGSNIEASKYSGVKVHRSLIKVYTIAGLLSGIAGIILASRLSSGQPTAGTGYELDVIAACVIGGASFSGGEGTVLGAMIGALIMGILRNGCNLLDISAFWQQVAIGSIIIIAVFFDQFRRKSI
ncbi:ABC transporter permease [candidate division KSB1 bacterium]